jgi:putative peptidoglycan lipid II flippase
MSQMLKSSGALGIATLTSRCLGMVREIAYARFMGDGWVAGAFMLAFTIPNLFRRLLGEGALTAACIPIFKEKEKTEGDAAVWQAANAVISGMFLAATAIILLVVAGVTIALWVRPWLPDTLLMLKLLRIMFPYMLLVCLTAIFMGLLNTRGRFFVPAMGATMLNVVMIASVFWLAPRLGRDLESQIFGLAIGVLIAGVVQAAFQWPSLRHAGYRFYWVNPVPDPTVKRVLHQMIPGTIGVAAFQINVLLTQVLAFWVDPGIVASFNYAVRLMELPQGVFGISLAVYLLPTLTGLAAEKDMPGYRATLRQGIGYLFFVNLLASILLIVLAEPIVRLLFERGKFGPDATHRAALALGCLAPGLVAFSLVNILARAFYALGDTRTPMKVSVVCLGINLVFSALLVVPLAQAGLGMANTVSATLNVTLLQFALKRKIGRLDWEPLVAECWRVLALVVPAGLAAWGLSWYGETHWGHSTFLARLLQVFVPATVAAVIFGVGCLALRVEAMRDVRNLVGRRFRRG